MKYSINMNHMAFPSRNSTPALHIHFSLFVWCHLELRSPYLWPYVTTLAAVGSPCDELLIPER